MKGKSYLDPFYKKFRIKVTHYEGSDSYRPSTNETKTYFEFLDNLPYYRTEEEAQKVLDKIAKEQDWEIDNRK